MFVHLLLFVCACAGLGMAQDNITQYPPYLWTLDEIAKAGKTLNESLLSISGHIPTWNHPKRQYAEIIHVIHELGLEHSGCLLVDYFETYQKTVNETAPEGLSKPQLVIDEVKELIKDFYFKTYQVAELVEDCVGTNCDAVVDNLVKQNPEKYALESEIFLLGGEAAAAFNENQATFEAASDLLLATKYVLTAAEDLEDHVKLLSDLYRVLNSPTC